MQCNFCHSPTTQLAVETAENMAALNVDYIAWIITVLGAINSNLTFIFDLNYFLWKLKTSKRQGVSSLLETKHKVCRFKRRNQFLELCQSKTLLKQPQNSCRIGNQLVVISEPRKIWGVFVFKFWGLWGSQGSQGSLFSRHPK